MIHLEHSKLVCPSTADYPRAERAMRFVIERTKEASALIGKGGAATVWNLRDGICVKVMEDRHNSENRKLLKLGNTVAEEARIQQSLSSFSHAGVRSPRCIAHIESVEPGGLNAIIMEQMNAVDLQRVLLGDFSMPHAYDRENFCKALDEYVQALHEERRIAHGDLYPRNIMVDRKSGLPVIIDFGRSVAITTTHASPIRKVVISDNRLVEKVVLLLEKFERGTLTKDDFLSIESKDGGVV